MELEIKGFFNWKSCQKKICMCHESVGSFGGDGGVTCLITVTAIKEQGGFFGT